MIVSHAHRFIFLKTRKTAGTSIEIALSRYCGPDDVLTPLRPEHDERLRRDLGGGRGAQHFRYPLRRLHLYRPRDVVRLLRGRGPKHAYNHMPAAAVRALVGKRIWDGYLKVAVERNPWDVVVSQYFFKFAERMPFDVYLVEHGLALLRGNREIYTIDGRVGVDLLLRYESLQAGLDAFAERVGLPTPIALPSAKSSTRPRGLPYRAMYDSATRRLVEQAARAQIEQLGYAFEEGAASRAPSPDHRPIGDS